LVAKKVEKRETRTPNKEATIKVIDKKLQLIGQIKRLKFKMFK
jgi:hypothetical protein